MQKIIANYLHKRKINKLHSGQKQAVNLEKPDGKPLACYFRSKNSYYCKPIPARRIADGSSGREHIGDGFTRNETRRYLFFAKFASCKIIERILKPNFKFILRLA